MQLLVGLGNPGLEHARNRHNVGFRAVEAVAHRHRISPWRRDFLGLAALGPLASERVLLLRPSTYMNESGRSVAAASDFYKIDVGDIVVFHDEIDLPPAKVRVKTGGGIAGHNGLRSISSYVGNDYRRVRIGVGHPGIKDLVYPYVLGNFTKEEQLWVEALCDIIADNAVMIITGEDSAFQNKVHLAMQAKGFGDVPGPGGPKPE